MKAALLLLALVSFFTPGCSDSNVVVPTAIFPLAYIVEVTGGNATVTQVDYTASNGSTTTLMNPVLPLTIAFSRTNGETARLVVVGTTGASSEITARIQDDPNLIPSPATHASATCAENTSPCSIDIQSSF